MKKVFLSMIVAFTFCLLVGCGKSEDEIKETTVTLDKKGNIECVLVDSFAEDYYSLSELQDMVQGEVSSYNQEKSEEVVSAKDAFLQGDNVVQEMTFLSYKDYNEFNQRNIFVGTVAEALEAGLTFRVGLEDVKNPGEFITGDHMEDMGDVHVLIADEPGIYYTFGPVTHVSDGVTCEGKKCVRVSEDMEGFGYILFR